jgi:hypothetical protein
VLLLAEGVADEHCRSMRETIKALSAAFSAPNVPVPLPDELCTTIENFLERYDTIDDHDSQRFHDDLYALYQRHVAASPEKHGPFLALLRLVQPAVTGEARLTTWWNLVLKPTIDGTGYKRQEIEDAREIVQNILVYDTEADRDGEYARLSTLFTKRLLDAYLARTNVPLSAEDIISPENEFLSHELEFVLVEFGRKMPKVRTRSIHIPSMLISTGAISRSRRALRTKAISHTGSELTECLRAPTASTSASCTRDITHTTSGKKPSYRCLLHRHRTCLGGTHHVPTSHLRRFDLRPSPCEDVFDIFQGSVLG